MSERCCDAMECRAEDICRALSIHTQKITDSCRDKDCIEDLRVYLTRESQNILDAAGNAKVRSAELIYTSIDVSPVAFHRSHYAVDLTFFYKVIADAAVGPCRPAAVCGLAMFSKRAILCGEHSGAHIFRSDCPGSSGGSIPTAVVEAIATNSRCEKVADICEKGKKSLCIGAKNNPKKWTDVSKSNCSDCREGLLSVSYGRQALSFYLDKFFLKSSVFSGSEEQKSLPVISYTAIDSASAEKLGFLYFWYSGPNAHSCRIRSLPGIVSGREAVFVRYIFNFAESC